MQLLVIDSILCMKSSAKGWLDLGMWSTSNAGVLVLDRQPLLTDFNVMFQAERDEEEIAEVEMILETYFMHVDNTFNKLQTLCEYIDDTEVSPHRVGEITH